MSDNSIKYFFLIFFAVSCSVSILNYSAADEVPNMNPPTVVGEYNLEQQLQTPDPTNNVPDNNLPEKVPITATQNQVEPPTQAQEYDYQISEDTQSRIELLEAEVGKIPQLQAEIVELKAANNNLAKKSPIIEDGSNKVKVLVMICIVLCLISMVLSTIAFLKARNHTYLLPTTKSQPEPSMPSYGRIGFTPLHSNRIEEIKHKISVWKTKGFNEEIIRKELLRFGYNNAEIEISMNH